LSDKSVLIKNFVDSALALVAEGLSGLNPEKAVLVDAALKAGSEICLVYATSGATVIGALHPPGPDADPIELFRVEISPSGLSN
jgi:hypothetical protein